MIEQDRSFLKWFLLTIVTCGIYDFYFMYKIIKDVNIVCDGDGEETPGLLVYILLSLVTCGIYAYYWFYKLGNRMQENARRYNFVINESGGTIVLFLLINLISGGIGTLIVMYYIIQNLNKLASAYNYWVSTNSGNDIYISNQ